MTTREDGMNKAISIAMLVAGLLSWFAPSFNGFLFEPSNVTDGEGRIVGAILTVGAAILWYIRADKEGT